MMKKLLLILILLLGLGGAAAGYYLFFMVPKADLKPTPITDKSAPPVTDNNGHAVQSAKQPEIQDYFVKDRKLAVLNGPGSQYFPERYLYISHPVKVLEHKAGWGRISPYFVYQKNGPEVAEWVKLSGLSTTPVKLTKQKREEIITSYIGHSDDFKLYRDAFIKVTEKLMDEKMCSPEDFEELHGWMKSINYQNRHVYFTYCGGLKVSDKIYFDVDSGEVFYK